MSAKTQDKRPISRSSGSPLSDRRAVVGSSGRPEEGMVLRSGAKQVAQALGKYDRPSGPHGQDTLRTGGGMKFNVSDMVDKSIGGPPDSSTTALPQGER
jgi:hypothetical protein